MRMFFSRCGWSRNHRRRGLQNQKLGRNQGVLYKIPRQRTDQPYLDGCTFQIDNQGVLYKTADSPLLIALALLLTIASGGLGMILPISLLIIGMGFAPLSAAIADYLGVLAIGLALMPPVFIAPPRLAFQPATDRLIGAAGGRMKGLLAIRAAAGLENYFLRGLFRFQP